MATGNITVVGSLNIDHIFFIDRLPDLGESYPARGYEKALGGKGANAAIATYRTCHSNPESAKPLGEADVNINVRMVGAVGKDDDGEWLRGALEKSNVDVSGVRKEEESTGMTFIMVEEQEDSRVRDNRLIYTIGANATLKSEDFTHIDALSNGVLPDLIVTQLEISLGAVETMLATAGKAKVKVLLNAAPANNILTELYQYVTHLVINETEAGILSGRELEEVTEASWEQIARGFLHDGVENVVITLGVGGAYFARLEEPGSEQLLCKHVKAFHVPVVEDPTGAGCVAFSDVIEMNMS